MTARRQARGRQEATFEIEGIAVPAALLDRESPVWRDRDACRDWLTAHGLSRAPAADRLELAEWLHGQHGGTHPANRRNLAAEQWAEANGIALDPRFETPRADWRALRRLGLID